MATLFERLVNGFRTRVSQAIEVLRVPREKPEEPFREVEKPEPVPEPTLEQILYEKDELVFPDVDHSPSEAEAEELEETELETELEDLEEWEVIEESKNTRGPFATDAEAEAYAEEIPVPTTVGKTSYGLFIVRVDYP